jgi:hypothetical protein
MAVELSEQSTHEDIEAAVDQAIEKQLAEHEPPEEETTDSEKVAPGKAVTERKDTPADDEEVASDDSETGEGDSADWRDDAKAEAAAYGIAEEDLADFQSREELDRAFKLLNRQLDTERDKVRGEEPGETKEEPPKDDSEAPKLDRDAYDETLVDLTEHQASRIAKLESALAAMEERFQSADAAAEEERFDRAVDDLGFAKLFGKTGEESEAEMKRRTDLFEHIRIEQQVMERLGRKVDYGALVQRVARSLFPDEYDKRLIKNHTRKVSAQSDKRQGGGATRPTDAPQTVRDEMRQLYKELDQQSG